MERKKLYQDRDWLYQKYINEKLSMTQIASLYGIKHTTINHWMKRHRIKARTISEAQNIKDKPYNHKSWLRQKYWEEKLSISEIGKICGVGSSNIFFALKRHGIKTRSISESKKGKKRPPFSEEWKRNTRNFGEKNGRWMGGTSFEPYGVEFNNKVTPCRRK